MKFKIGCKKPSHVPVPSMYCMYLNTGSSLQNPAQVHDIFGPISVFALKMNVFNYATTSANVVNKQMQ
jgi:hypothetical protein